MLSEEHSWAKLAIGLFSVALTMAIITTTVAVDCCYRWCRRKCCFDNYAEDLLNMAGLVLDAAVASCGAVVVVADTVVVVVVVDVGFSQVV